MAVLDFVENIFYYTVQAGIYLLEFAGVGVVIIAAIHGIIGLFKKDGHVRLKLAQGIALALEFKLGSEVLRTVIVREWSELIILGAVILLRGALTFIIHWEIKVEESRLSQPVKVSRLYSLHHKKHTPRAKEREDEV